MVCQKNNSNFITYTYIFINRLKKREVKDGLGIMFWPDGTKYEGQFKNDCQSGFGRKLFSNGEFYIGHF